MSQPVSVVMTVYNGRTYLAQQVESVLAQLEPQDQFVVVDDASSDGSIDWIEALADERIVVRRQSRNLGVRQSFENGLRLACHPIVFLCDQDDVWLPGKRNAFVAGFERDPRVLVVISDAEVIDAAGHVTAASFMELRGGFRGGIFSTLVRNRYLGCAMAVRRSLLDKALPIPHHVPMHDMWLGILGRALGRTCYLPARLLQYRRHGGNVSPSSRQAWGRMLRWRLDLATALVARLVCLGLGTAPRRRSKGA